MAIEYTWNFSSIAVKPSVNGLTDVVNNYEWRRIATDGEFSAVAYGQIALSDPDPVNFIAFSNLTKQDLENWTVAVLTAEEVAVKDQVLANQIFTEKNPPTVIKSAPWETE